MRCGVCGRPPQSEIDAGKEVLLPREIPDQGCFAEFQAEYARLIALVDPKTGLRTVTDKDAADQALEFARTKHTGREFKAFDDKRILRLQRNAAGLHAEDGTPLPGKTRFDVDGVTPLKIAGVVQYTPFTVAELDAIKADAQARLDALTKAKDPVAKSPGQLFKEALGL